MNTDRELMQQALEELESVTGHFTQTPSTLRDSEVRGEAHKAITALRERLAQPEFPTHEEGEDGWSEWVCPDPKSYLMKCCDCGLVHEAQFGVVRYASETERENCEKVDDPNLQAVFRMRRSEQWTPEDTAQRAGGLPMAEQPAQQQEPFGYFRYDLRLDAWVQNRAGLTGTPFYTSPYPRQWYGLTDEEIMNACAAEWASHPVEVGRVVEAKLREKNT